jgi:hypothetical protein
VGGLAVIFIGWAELAGVSFEPTDASQFKAWAAQPLGTAGGIALGGCILGLAAWFLSRRYGRLLALAGLAGDLVSVRRFALLSIQRCYISASKDGHSVDANVTAGIRGITVSVRLAG